MRQFTLVHHTLFRHVTQRISPFSNFQLFPFFPFFMPHRALDMSSSSLGASPARHEARQHIKQLHQSLTQAALRLGTSHCIVEQARLDLKVSKHMSTHTHIHTYIHTHTCQHTHKCSAVSWHLALYHRTGSFRSQGIRT